MNKNDRNTFEYEARAPRKGVVGEFIDFLKHNKKWWMLPVLIVMLLVSALLILGSTSAGAFIYTLF